jgi:hypothetical protein
VKKNRRNQTANASPDNKRKRQSRKQLAASQYKRSRMEIVAYAIGIGAFVFAAAAALFGVVHYRDATIWTTCAAIVFAVIGGFCWLQDREWKKDAASNLPKLNHDRPYVWIKGMSPRLDNLKEPKNTPIVIVYLGNSGTAPAFDVEAETAATLAFAQLTDVPPRERAKTLPAKFFIPVGGQIEQKLLNPSPDPTLKSKIESNEVFLYVVGEIKYLNRLDNVRYTTKFCFVYGSAEKTFQITPFGNEVE